MISRNAKAITQRNSVPPKKTVIKKDMLIPKKSANLFEVLDINNNNAIFLKVGGYI